MLDLSLLRRVSEDRALGSEILFSHRHPQSSAEFHVAMHTAWGCRNEFVLFEAFREAGKTTAAEEYIALEGCFGNFHYGLIIGETYSKACQRLEAIDKECRTNTKLHRLFGGPVLSRKSIENRLWFKSGGMLEAWGWEQELQSFKYGDHRPDLAYLDDIENSERVRDSAAVDQSMRKFWLELVPAMDKNRRRIRYGQTRRAEDCMVTRFAQSKEWLYFGVPICNGPPFDPKTVSNWPERYPMDWIQAEYRRYESAGMLSEFLQSYMLQVVNPESKPFKEDMLQSLEVSPYHWMPRYAIYDPSRTSNEKRTREKGKSDRTGKVVVSRMGSRILVHESGGHFWQPDQFISDVFHTQETHKPAKIGIEKNSLDDWLLQPLRIESMRRGVVLPLKTLQAPQDRSKDEFIMGLQPFAHAKDIVLVGGKIAHPDLVAEWCNFPTGSRDVMNALAYALRMFSGTPIYEDFSGANLGEAPEPKKGEDVYVGFNASPDECVAVVVVKEGRRLIVSADYAASGALSDAVKTVAFGVRSDYPRANLQCYVPADTFDQWQRIALVPALRSEKFTPYRSEHAAVARGCLSERIRTVWHNARLLMVDRGATGTLNSLSAGYALAAERGGRSAHEPESGVSRLLAEALECLVAMLDKVGDNTTLPKNANLAYNPSGQRYMTSNPR